MPKEQIAEAPSTQQTPAPVPEDLPALTLSAEVPFPDDIALLLETGCFQCDGMATGLARVYRDSSGLVQRELLVSAGAHSYYPDGQSEQLYFAGDIPIPRETLETAKGPQQYDSYVTGIAVSGDGSEIIVSVCLYPGCGIGMDAWSADGRVNLYRSADGGRTWADYGRIGSGSVLGIVSPGRVFVAERRAPDGPPAWFMFPDGEPVEHAPTASGVLQGTGVLADGTIVWLDRSGQALKSDGTVVVAVPFGIGPFRLQWITQHPTSGDVAVYWSANDPGQHGFLTRFSADGKPIVTYRHNRFIVSAIWLSEHELIANVGIEASELTTQVAEPFLGLLPATIDLTAGEIHPITEYFLDDGAEMGRNYVRGVQRLPPAELWACPAADLEAGIGGRNGGAGMLMTSIVFNNISSEPCQLRGTPDAQLLEQVGNRLPTRQIALCENASCPPLRTVRVEPKGSASVAFVAVPYRSDFACATPCGAAYSLRVTFRNGESMIVALQPEYDRLTLCNDAVQVGWFQ